MISENDAIRWVHDHAFSHGNVGRIGIELEWIVKDWRHPEQQPSIARVRKALGSPLPYGGILSFEPGGQLELSTLPAKNLAKCLESAISDLSAVRQQLGTDGLCLIGTGLDLHRRERLVQTPRASAFELHHDRFGPVGRTWTRNTASIHINVDAGDESDGWRGYRRRWELANKLGPILLAMFANSPVGPWPCGRQMARFHTDPTRSRPVTMTGDPHAAWTEYVLDAYVIGFPAPHPLRWTQPSALTTMRQWLQGCGPRPAELADLKEHITTLGPPVRPRGYLELRMIDAQYEDNWLVPVVVVGALLDDAAASDLATGIVAGLRTDGPSQDWLTAASRGMGDPVLADTAQSCMEIAIQALPRLGLPELAVRTVEQFARNHTWQSASPAGSRTPHDLLGV